MLDTRRIEIDFFAGFEVDARCRVFVAGEFKPLPCNWPYVTLNNNSVSFSLKAPEVCALTFLGQDGCDDVFRELFSVNVFKGHPRVKEIAINKGISQWAVLEAARRHHSNFRISTIISQLKNGHFGPTMWLHRAESVFIEHYDVYDVASAGQRQHSLFDHVLTVRGVKYRFRSQTAFQIARIGEKVDFLFRIDVEGGRFVVVSSFTRTSRNESQCIQSFRRLPNK